MLHNFEIDEEGTLRDLDSVSEDGVQHDFIGEIRFYDMGDDGGWIEFSAYFVKGVLKEVHLISDTRISR